MTEPLPPRTETLRAGVEAALREVIDPELGINVVDLGLVYRIEVNGGAVEVDLTMTTAACPLGEQILLDAQQRVEAVPGVEHAMLQLVWEPAWRPERMSPAAQERLGWSG